MPGLAARDQTTNLLFSFASARDEQPSAGSATTRPNMKAVLCVAVIAALYCAVEAKNSPPKTQVYSRNPGKYGEENVLICHVSDFHPPDITIKLLKNGVEIPDAKQTDLVFNQDWHFHLTKHVAFTPKEGENYACKVTHGTQEPKIYGWEPNM